jgi:hypothetical protein
MARLNNLDIYNQNVLNSLPSVIQLDMGTTGGRLAWFVLSNIATRCANTPGIGHSYSVSDLAGAVVN